MTSLSSCDLASALSLSLVVWSGPRPSLARSRAPFFSSPNVASNPNLKISARSSSTVHRNGFDTSHGEFCDSFEVRSSRQNISSRFCNSNRNRAKVPVDFFADVGVCHGDVFTRVTIAQVLRNTWHCRLFCRFAHSSASN